MYQQPLQLPDKVWCFLPGDTSTFPVDIDDIRVCTVGDLRSTIKRRRESLGMVDINNLTLYRGEIEHFDDKEIRLVNLGYLSKKLDQCTPLDVETPLLKVLRPTPSPGRKIYIIVNVINVVSSVCVRASMACMRVLTLLVVSVNGWLLTLTVRYSLRLQVPPLKISNRKTSLDLRSLDLRSPNYYFIQQNMGPNISRSRPYAKTTFGSKKEVGLSLLTR
jgi:hypothetical protein